MEINYGRSTRGGGRVAEKKKEKEKGKVETGRWESQGEHWLEEHREWQGKESMKNETVIEQNHCFQYNK